MNRRILLLPMISIVFDSILKQVILRIISVMIFEYRLLILVVVDNLWKNFIYHENERILFELKMHSIFSNLTMLDVKLVVPVRSNHILILSSHQLVSTKDLPSSSSAYSISLSRSATMGNEPNSSLTVNHPSTMMDKPEPKLRTFRGWKRNTAQLEKTRSSKGSWLSQVNISPSHHLHQSVLCRCLVK